MENNRNEIYGARAAIEISFLGDIEELALKLSNALLIPEFKVDFSELPPHEKIGMAEVLGWEIWLKKISTGVPNLYRFEMETEDSLREIHEGRMHDLSPWLARVVKGRCDLDTNTISASSPYKN